VKEGKKKCENERSDIVVFFGVLEFCGLFMIGDWGDRGGDRRENGRMGAGGRMGWRKGRGVGG